MTWVSIADMNKKVFIESSKEEVTTAGIKSANMKIVGANTVLFSFKLSVGKVCITAKPVYTNEAIAALPIIDNKRLFTKYLFYAMQAQDFSYLGETAAKGLTLNKAKLNTIKIPLPPLPTQQKIAAILDEADALRRKDKALLAKYDELLLAVFYDMFGDPVKNEKGWEVRKFGSVYHSIRYGTGTPPIYQEEGIPFIRATNVKSGTIANKGMVYVSVNDAKKIEKCFIKEGDLILVRSGVNTGECARVNKEFSGALAGYDLIIEIDEPFSVFYNYLINSPFGKKMIKPITRRAAQPHLNAEQTENLQFYFPPKELQEKFSTIYFAVVNAKSQIIQQQTQSENLFQSLMQRAFKGELVG